MENAIRQAKFSSNTQVHRIEAIRHEHGGKGCSQSHTKALLFAQRHGFTHTLILEDDAVLDEVVNVGDIVQNGLNHIKDTYNVWILGTESMYPEIHGYVHTKMWRASSIASRTAYIVHLDYIPILLECNHFSNTNLTNKLNRTNYHRYAGDRVWQRCQKPDSWIVSIPNIFHQSESFSNIQNKKMKYAAQTTIEAKKPYYRMGDTICGKYKPKIDMIDHIRFYPHSIVAEYFKYTLEYGNLSILESVVRKNKYRIQSKLPNSKTATLHLRLGDVLEESMYTVDEHLESEIKFNNHVYTRPASFFIDTLKQMEVSKCMLVFGNLKKQSFTKSNEYIKKLSKTLLHHGYEVYINQSDMDPDLDFTFLCHSPNLIVSGGGYAKLAKKIHTMINSRKFETIAIVQTTQCHSEVIVGVIDAIQRKNPNIAFKVYSKTHLRDCLPLYIKQNPELQITRSETIPNYISDVDGIIFTTANEVKYGSYDKSIPVLRIRHKRYRNEPAEMGLSSAVMTKHATLATKWTFAKHSLLSPYRIVVVGITEDRSQNKDITGLIELIESGFPVTIISRTIPSNIPIYSNVDVFVSFNVEQMVEYLTQNNAIIWSMCRPNSEYHKNSITGAIPLAISCNVPLILDRQMKQLFDNIPSISYTSSIMEIIPHIYYLIDNLDIQYRKFMNKQYILFYSILDSCGFKI